MTVEFFYDNWVCQIFTDILKNFTNFLDIVEWCRVMSFFAMQRRVMSSDVEWCRVMSSDVEWCQLNFSKCLIYRIFGRNLCRTWFFYKLDVILRSPMSCYVFLRYILFFTFSYVMLCLCIFLMSHEKCVTFDVVLYAYVGFHRTLCCVTLLCRASYQ